MVNTPSKVSTMGGSFGNWEEYSDPPTDQQIQDSVSKITNEIMDYAKQKELDINDYSFITVIKDPQDSNMIYGYTVGVKAVRRVATK